MSTLPLTEIALPAAPAPASWRPWATPAALMALLALCTLLATQTLSTAAQLSLTEMLIRVVVVVGMSVFIGNSGIMSFGHMGFMCIGAFAAAWAATEPMAKAITLPGLPQWLATQQYGFAASMAGATALAAAVALPMGLALGRLSGIAASIATFAFLAIVNSVYANWDTVTGGTGSLINIPTVVGPWTALAFACLAVGIAHVFQQSRYGLMLRATREDEVAASACAIHAPAVRLAAFVLSGALVGMGGALQAQFLGVLSVDAFYLGLSFVTLAMLVVGGIGSLTGAVVGVLAVTALVELLRAAEAGLSLGGLRLALPAGSQEIGLGVFLALVLVLRPAGLAGAREWWAPRG
jgi:branched-chain amino acid transport system permease protein